MEIQYQLYPMKEFVDDFILFCNKEKYCLMKVLEQVLDDCLNQEYYHRCAKLMKYSPKSDEDFYLFDIIGVEINLIMDKLVSLQAKEQYSFNLSIPTYLAKKTSFNIDGLVNIESFKDLLQYLSKTRYYKVL